MIKNKVAIIGLGYVGLPLAQAIAQNTQYQVVGIDIDPHKVAAIEEFEAGTDQALIAQSEYIIICVPTPVKDNKMPNLSALKEATKTTTKYLEKGQKIIIESTINPGVCEEVLLPILESSGLKGGKDFELSHCPERINPGDSKWNVLNIPRNIGSLTPKGNHIIANFYRSFLEAEIKELSCLKSAEASKVIENTFRDINIAYVNELSKSFDLMGIDLVEVIEAASNKPFAFLAHYPSCGVGGHCIPVDPYYLIESAKEKGFEHHFLKLAREINESMPQYTIDLLKQKLAEHSLKQSEITVAILGLTYKANVPDLRESPSLKIIEICAEENIPHLIYDPLFTEKNTHPTLSETLAAADCIVLAVNHREFTEINAELLKKQGIKIVIDGKNCLNKKEITAAGITYKGIGH